MRGLRLLTCLSLLVAAPASAELDLSRVAVSRLDNGLTVLILEDHSLPVVSTQIVYMSGTRDEAPGHTGLAHFLEHLAFRASENYPDGAATDAIYDAGGEWHGYTWIDQTTYYATMPAAGLALLLDIEADRMARVTIDPESIEAEIGAVITEMHGYENDPSSVLFDEVVSVALQAHPYHIPTIGYESDVEALTVEDAEAYYRAHYAPDNAVLAIVGDIDAVDALAEVRARFGAIPAARAATRTAAVEPPQRGERRMRLSGPVDRRYMKMVYPAPSASSPDYAAFLVLQQLVSGGSGVNFHQNDWGTPSVEGAALHGAAEDVTSWFIPTADPYVFMLSASTETDGDEAALEAEFERRLASFRAHAPSDEALAAARSAIAGHLAFDIGTTEDAAHQLAFFECIGALSALRALPMSLDAVTPADVQRVAQTYLDPRRRTVGWYVPGERQRQARPGAGDPARSAARDHGTVEMLSAGAPELRMLSGGLPGIVQGSPLSPTVTVEIVLSAPSEEEGEAALLAGFGSVTRSGLAADLADLIAEARDAVAGATSATASGPGSDDPYTRMDEMIAVHVARHRRGTPPLPVVAVVSGAIDPDTAFAALDSAFGDMAPAQPPASDASVNGNAALAIERARIDLPLSQAALGYVVPGPRPGTREGLAWRMLLYVLTHEYGGRLGDTAISDRGLTYYIDSAYRTDGHLGWVTIGSGVDSDKLDAMEAALRSELLRLASDPPTVAEVDAARRHMLGRDLSAAQSNAEIADRLARIYVERGSLPDHAALAAALAEITPEDVTAATADFARGTIIRVDVAIEEGSER
jgi:zinc protease